MTPRELKDAFRRDIDDLKTPYLWSDADVVRYMNVAYEEFCRLTDYLSDASTADVCEAAVVADEKFVDLSPLITKIRQAKLESASGNLVLKTLQQMNSGWMSSDYGWASNSNWQTATGTPKVLVTDVELNKGRLVPIPTADDTLELMVYRLPLDPVTLDSAEFEVQESRYQEAFLLKMFAEAYRKHDSDVNNEVLAMQYDRKFSDRCTEVYWELKRKRDKGWTTRSVW